MEYIIVRTDYSKYGIVYYNEISSDISDTIFKVHFDGKLSYTELSSERLSVISRDDISDKDVYNANYWKRYLGDRSMYIPITDQRKYERCYDRVYEKEIKEQVKSWLRFIELANKGRLYETMFTEQNS